ncbi:MAG: DUF192 domain-containing protein [Candidatus Magasanikbacteria bacterium]|jgi:uncharacterized protein|nr:DUF192 domain-containing protein [Candidatus Magasanikbacteria bacterium]MBT4071878.1 DUF192 domain-containing protein [Candidatus Magasanikbacteria bacterium]
MKKKNIVSKLQIIFLVIFVFGLVFLFFSNKKYDVVQVKIHEHTLDLLVAETPKQKYLGLGKRDELEPYHGMLFSYKKDDRHGIVMRDMRFPIDVVWLKDNRVIDMVANVPLEPGKSEWELIPYYPRAEVDIILEFSSGAIETYGISLGDEFIPVYESN